MTTDQYVAKHAAPVSSEDVHVITHLPENAGVETKVEEPKKVLIATPCYGGQVTEAYLQSILAVVLQAAAHGIDVDVFTSTGESLITRARNEAVHRFLTAEKGYTHLFFIDADIEFTWQQFERVLNSGYDVAAAVYPLKTINWDRIVGKPNENKTQMIGQTIEVVINAVDPAGEDGFAKCLDAGTGFMCIQRSVFEQIREAHPELMYNNDALHAAGEEVYAFFDTMIRDGRYLSEDYAFCRLWQDLGGFVYVDMASPILIHQGLLKYGKVE